MQVRPIVGELCGEDVGPLGMLYTVTHGQYPLSFTEDVENVESWKGTVVSHWATVAAYTGGHSSRT